MGGDAVVTRHLSTVAELVGLVLIAVAAFVVDWRLGLAVVGVLLVLLGWVLDRPRVFE